MLEPRESAPHLNGWTVGFDLARSTGIERANEIARYLNENLGKLCLASVQRTFESDETDH